MPPADPFFSLPQNSEWNACIGRQSDEENYADGYIDAAIELATAVIEKGMYEKRDTLVLPILYNARHAIELNLKLVIGAFVRAGILNTGHPANHNILSHLKFLEVQAVPDELFRERLSALRPFIYSLAQVDDDGQELRFHENRDGQRSMEGRALANISVIRASLVALQEALTNLKFRAYSLCDEWHTETRTTHCSRRDLVEIAQSLPPRQNWDTQEFVECREAIKERYGIGNRQFSLALDKIQKTRELAGLIAIESHLVHLSDQNAEFLLGQWEKLHPPRGPNDAPYLDYFGERDWEAIMKRRTTESQLISEIIEELSEEEFADAETVFYLARDGVFAEFYEKLLERKKVEFRVRGDFRQQVHDLMSKTNFRRCFVKGLRTVGRLDLSARLGGNQIH